jgi:hypothetical protein
MKQRLQAKSFLLTIPEIIGACLLSRWQIMAVGEDFMGDWTRGNKSMAGLDKTISMNLCGPPCTTNPYF